mmetsp:Transcript_15036/g.23267  ORF Transcript_15036/g.23267 Transcript_15036/m.23267 type:complete len:111 (+) Transcript_15036:3072-3404(+)
MLNILSLFSEKFQASVNSVLVKNFNITDDAYHSHSCKLKKLLLQVHPLVQESLYATLVRKHVVMPLVLKFKIGLCTDRLMVLINRFVFSKRFKSLASLSEFSESYFSKVD